MNYQFGLWTKLQSDIGQHDICQQVVKVSLLEHFFNQSLDNNIFQFWFFGFSLQSETERHKHFQQVFKKMTFAINFNAELTFFFDSLERHPPNTCDTKGGSKYGVCQGKWRPFDDVSFLIYNMKLFMHIYFKKYIYIYLFKTYKYMYHTIWMSFDHGWTRNNMVNMYYMMCTYMYIYNIYRYIYRKISDWLGLPMRFIQLWRIGLSLERQSSPGREEAS